MSYIIEFEGFSLLERFVLKEVTVINLDSGQTDWFFISSPFPFRFLLNEEKKIVRFCEKNLHHIYWGSGRQPIRDFIKYIRHIKPCETVYTKGLQKVKILKSYLNDYVRVVDLEALGCQNISSYVKTKLYVPCALSFHKKSLHCSHVKAAAFQDFIKNQDESTT